MTPVQRRGQLTDTAADAPIEQACRLLRLPTNSERYNDLAGAAARQQAVYKGFLVELLSVACDEREERRKTRLVREADFPCTKRLDTFDFVANPLIDPALVHALAKGAWIKTGQPLC
jgi:DNA replication protein DnaC